jgi:hypothetical protein
VGVQNDWDAVSQGESIHERAHVARIHVSISQNLETYAAFSEISDIAVASALR